MQQKKYAVFVVAALAISAISYLAFGLPGYCSDDFMRLYLAAKWSISPVYMQIAEWPPLYSVVYGSFLKLPFAPLGVAHGLTGALMGLFIFIACLTIERLSGSSSVALLGGIILLVNPLFFRLTLSTLSEPLYLCLCAVLFYFLYRWRENNRESYYYAAVVTVIALTLTRIDCWIPLTLFFGGWAIKDRSKKIALLTMACVFFPLLWTAEITERSGSPWTLYRAYRDDSVEFYAGRFLVPYLHLVKDTLINFPFLLLLPTLAWKKSRLAQLSLGLFAMQLFLTWGKLPTVFPERIFALPGFLSILCFCLHYGRKILSSDRGAVWITTTALCCFTVVQFYFRPPTYHRQAYDLGKKLAHSPAWHRIETELRIGSHVGTDKLPIIALQTRSVMNFHHLFTDADKPGILFMPYPSPNIFLFDDPNAAAILKKNNPSFGEIRQDPFLILADAQDPRFIDLKKEFSPQTK